MAKHGKWIFDPEEDDDDFKVVPLCSLCLSEAIHSDDGGGTYYKTPYCPWCGAKMDLKD